MASTPRVPVHIRLPEDVVRWVDARAEKNDLTRSQVIRLLLKQAMAGGK